MAEPQLIMRRIDSPCHSSTGSGPFNAAPIVRFRPLFGGQRAFFVIGTAESRSRLRLLPVLPGTIVTIESHSAPELRVTTSAATGRLSATAECK
jgi:hypothetical protein